MQHNLNIFSEMMDYVSYGEINVKDTNNTEVISVSDLDITFKYLHNRLNESKNNIFSENMVEFIQVEIIFKSLS